MSKIETHVFNVVQKTKKGVTPEASEYHVSIVPGRKITIYKEEGSDLKQYRTFEIDDEAEYDSYNMRYLGLITKITANTVTIQKTRGSNVKIHRLSIYEFCWRNYNLNVEEVRAQNAVESMNI